LGAFWGGQVGLIRHWSQYKLHVCSVLRHKRISHMFCVPPRIRPEGANIRSLAELALLVFFVTWQISQCQYFFCHFV